MKVGVYIELNSLATRGNILLDAFRDNPRITEFHKLLPSTLRVQLVDGQEKFTFKDFELNKENLDLLVIRGGLKDIQLNLQLVKYCQRNGIKVFDNNLHRVGYLINKKADHINFSVSGLPIPKTFIFNDISQVQNEFFEFPIVMKVVSSSRGKKVYKAHSYEEIYAILNTFKDKVSDYLFQEFIDYEYDLRLVVIGDEVVGAMRRIPQAGEFRANYSLGGDVELFDAPEAMKKLAVRVAQSCELKVSGVDLLVDKKGDIYVLEANRNPGLSGISKALGYNVAEKLVDYILKETNI